MKVLVTGGAGFIGSHYVRTLLQGGYPGYDHAHVTVLDKLVGAGNLASLEPVAASPRFSFVRGDIGDTALLASVVPGHHVVINFAVQSRPERSVAGAAGFVATNVAGASALLQACLDARVQKVVQVSTDEVYGSVASGSWGQDAPLDPSSVYSAAKAGGDLLAQAYARTHGLNVSITRCCHTYGPYQHPENLVPLFVTNLIEGLKVPLQGDGGSVRGWVHVDDHCQGVQLVLEQGQPGGVYHIAGDAELSDLELTRALLDCFGVGWDMVAHVGDGEGDRRHSLDDSALRQMGYTPRIPLRDGLNAIVRWYRDNQRWWQPLKQPWPGAAGAPQAAPGGEANGQAVSASPARWRRGSRRRKLRAEQGG
jgi:dTDP-glucose 4,6-dehydratase